MAWLLLGFSNTEIKLFRFIMLLEVLNRRGLRISDLSFVSLERLDVMSTLVLLSFHYLPHYLVYVKESSCCSTQCTFQRTFVQVGIFSVDFMMMIPVFGDNNPPFCSDVAV